MSSDYDPEVTVPSLMPITVGGSGLTSPAYDNPVYEEGGELVTTIRNKVWVTSIQNLTRVQAGPTGANLWPSKCNNCLFCCIMRVVGDLARITELGKIIINHLPVSLVS